MKRLLIYIPLLVFTLYACSDDDTSSTTENEYQLSDAPRTPKRSQKRGVSYGFQLPEEDMSLLGGAISWFYNWGPDCDETLTHNAKSHNVTYCPMAWNAAFDEARIRNAATVFADNRYLLAFNEPNLTDQCNLTPAEAAKEWPRLMALARDLNMRVVSPAMNYGTLEGYSDPIVWLDEFFSLVPLEDVDAIALHCYMGSAAALKSFIDRFDKYGKPIWLTEFCAWEPHISSIKAQMNYMSEAINYLEACDKVERYAWFIPRAAGAVDSYPYMQLLTKSSPFELSDLGRVFAGISTIDKDVYSLAGQTIEAENFTACNASEGVQTQDAFVSSAHYAPSTDDEDTKTIMITDFGIGKWTEYQIELHKPTTDYLLQIRLNAIVKSVIDIKLTKQTDNTEYELSVKCDNNKATWQTVTTPLGSLTPSKYTLRLTCSNGLLNINNLKVKYAQTTDIK